MGGSQSSRKISVDNENAIQVSQEALDRIQSRIASRQPEQESYSPHYYESQKRQQDFAAEEAYWSRRIDGLKKAHEKINNGMLVEYQKTLKEANQLFEIAQKDTIATKLPPCQEQKAKVLQCYDENRNKTLLCSLVVNEFNDCVCRSRIAAVSATS